MQVSRLFKHVVVYSLTVASDWYGAAAMEKQASSLVPQVLSMQLVSESTTPARSTLCMHAASSAQPALGIEPQAVVRDDSFSQYCCHLAAMSSLGPPSV